MSSQSYFQISFLCYLQGSYFLIFKSFNFPIIIIQGVPGSNWRWRFRRPACYHYTNPLYWDDGHIKRQPSQIFLVSFEIFFLIISRRRPPWERGRKGDFLYLIFWSVSRLLAIDPTHLRFIIVMSHIRKSIADSGWCHYSYEFGDYLQEHFDVLSAIRSQRSIRRHASWSGWWDICHVRWVDTIIPSPACLLDPVIVSKLTVFVGCFLPVGSVVWCWRLLILWTGLYRTTRNITPDETQKAQTKPDQILSHLETSLIANLPMIHPETQNIFN